LRDFANDLAVDFWSQFLFGAQDAHLENDTLIPLSDKISELLIDVSHNWRLGLRSFFSRSVVQDDTESQIQTDFERIVGKRLDTFYQKEEKGVVPDTLRKLNIVPGGAKRGKLNDAISGMAHFLVSAAIIPWVSGPLGSCMSSAAIQSV
jgi:hypothetical protein